MLQCPGLVEARGGAVAALSCWCWPKVNIGCLTPSPPNQVPVRGSMHLLLTLWEAVRAERLLRGTVTRSSPGFLLRSRRKRRR